LTDSPVKSSINNWNQFMNKIITLPAVVSGLILFSGAASAQLVQFPLETPPGKWISLIYKDD